jgi:ATP/maltotriose-dependent transcriptional regulator MalT
MTKVDRAGARHEGTWRPTALPAKISTPLLSGVVERPRLLEELEKGRSLPGIWVTAAAGAGKTPLVANYLARARRPCTWYQADPRDRDIASLFTI